MVRASRTRRSRMASPSLVTRLADSRSFVVKVWELARPYWFSEERWFARIALALVLGGNFFLVWMSKQLNDWNGDFFNALQEKQADAFWRLLLSLDGPRAFFFSFAGLVTAFIVVAVLRFWLRQYLTLRWRRWLTGVYTRTWLAERTYYRLELGDRSADNPDQRIEQDIAAFTTQTLTLTLGLISEILTLVTFTVVLWGLSGPITVAGLAIPGFMVWVALIYAVIGSGLTYLVGRRLVQLNFQLERYNADFRYRLVRVRENAESIALYGGEPDEQRRLAGAFERIFVTAWRAIIVNLRLTSLNVFYGQVAGIFPIVVQAPRYFAGEIMLGTLTRTAGAFGQVQGSLSWFVDSFTLLADWKATTDRLTGFADAMTAARRAQQEQQGFAVTQGDAGALTLSGVDVRLPDGRALLEGLELDIRAGEAVVLQGPSGSGKSTLFRVLAGLWPFGSGSVSLPAGARVLFLPQRPYLPLGTLAQVLAYPDPPSAHPEAAAAEALAAADLAHLTPRLGEEENWSMVLSPGEQQRLAFARAFLFRPDWLFLDEATAALDEATEGHLYEELKRRLPAATLVSIAHKPSVLRFHSRRIAIDPATHTLSSGPLPAPA